MSALQEYGKNNNQLPFESKVEYLKDYIFFAPGDTLTNQRAFVPGDTKPTMYRAGDFPSTSQAYKIQGIRVQMDSNFSATTEAERLAKYRHALNNTIIQFVKNDKVLLKLPFSQLSKITIEPNPTLTAGVPEFRITEKFSDIYMLPEALQFGAGQNLNVEIIPAKGLTVAALDTTKKGEGYYPEMKFTSDKAFGIMIELEAVKIQDAN